MTSAKPKIGEWSTEEPVTEDVENMCIEIAKQVGVHFDVCIPKSFRVQELAGGTNYLVKVKVGVDDKYLHVMMCRAFYSDKVTEGIEPTLTGVQYPKTASDHLVPFEHRK